MYLLAKGQVACVPGEAFFLGPGETNLVRFCFAKDDEELEEACLRLEQLASDSHLLRPCAAARA